MVVNNSGGKTTNPGKSCVKSLIEEDNYTIPENAVGSKEEKEESEESADPSCVLKKHINSGVCTLKGASPAGFLGIGKISSVKVAVGEVGALPPSTLGLDPAETPAGAGVLCACDSPEDVKKNVLRTAPTDETDVAVRCCGIGTGGGYDECE